MDAAFDSISKKEITADEALKKGYINKLFVCGVCGGRVKLIRSNRQRPHFRHLRGEADINCDLYFSSSMGVGRPFVNLDKGLDLELVFSNIDWSINLILPELKKEVVQEYDTLLLSRLKFTVDGRDAVTGNHLWPGSGGWKVSVFPREYDYEVKASGELPLNILQELESRTPGVNPSGTIFAESPIGCIRLWNGQGLYAGKTFYLVGKEHMLKVPIHNWPKEISYKPGKSLSNWMMWEISMPVNPTTHVENWLKRFGYTVKLLHAQLKLVWPPPSAIRADGTIVIDRGHPIIWGISSSIPQPISPLLCHRVPSGKIDVEVLPKVKGNETEYVSFNEGQLGLHQFFLSGVEYPPFNLEIGECTKIFSSASYELFPKCKLSVTEIKTNKQILNVTIPGPESALLNFSLKEIFGAEPQYKLQLTGVEDVKFQIYGVKNRTIYHKKTFSATLDTISSSGFIDSDYIYLVVTGFGTLKLYGSESSRIDNIDLKQLKRIINYMVSLSYNKGDYLPIPNRVRRFLLNIRENLLENQNGINKAAINTINLFLQNNKIPSNMYGYLLPLIKNA